MEREPRVFSIPPGVPFMPVLADALLSGELFGGWPDGISLADATIYLPTRRSGRVFARTLAQRSGSAALLLPRIVPLAEADGPDEGDPFGAAPVRPSVPPLERRLILTRLVQAWARGGGTAPGDLLLHRERRLLPDSPADAVALAGDLEALMDAIATEGVDWRSLGEAVEAEFSRYFALTLEFVRIAHESWPAILAQRNGSDPVRRRHEAVLAEAARLVRAPPAGPVVAAGSTGSVPGTAALLAAIARAPRGALVLPGLDADLDPASWDAIGGGKGRDDDGPLFGHPQFMLRRLLTTFLKLGRDAVVPLGTANPGSAARRRLLSEAMRPAATTEGWAAMPAAARRELATAGLDGLALIEAADEREEALAIALALRETLAVDGRTAAFVTPDRALARRVAAELGRWDVRVEDSAGIRLGDSLAGRLARLAAEVMASEFAPVPVLALLAHPLVRLGLSREALDRAAAALEIGALRGPAPAPGLSGLADALALRRQSRSARDPLPRQNLSERDWSAAADLLDRLDSAYAGFTRTPGESADLVALAAGHAETLDALLAPGPSEAAADEPSCRSVFSLLDELALCAPAAGTDVSVQGPVGDYPAFFAVLARERVLPPDGAAVHPRVTILGLLEARLLPFDRVVLGGLDEGLWPPTARSDAFLNRPMRLALGLSPPERRIGQTAHDFVQALGTADAVVTRAAKRAGKPTVPSRFLERLRAFAGSGPWGAARARGDRYLALAAALDRTSVGPPLPRPAPRPGPARFPARLSVTEVETLVRDPYAIFARHVLRLTPLGAVAEPPSAAERGTILHGILGDFVRLHPGPLPERAEQILLQMGADAFGGVADAYPEAYALWWPAFERTVPDLLRFEAERRANGAALHAEIRGELLIPVDGRSEPFRVTARADRIELDQAGRATVVDFKTGRVPTAKEVAVGFSPQLTLEAAILAGGGFPGVPAPAESPDMLYVKLGGRALLEMRPLETPRGDRRSPAALVEAHSAGLRGLVRRYAVDGAGYLSRPYAQYAHRFSAYDHLARVKEWSLASEDPDA